MKSVNRLGRKRESGKEPIQTMVNINATQLLVPACVNHFIKKYEKYRLLMLASLCIDNTFVNCTIVLYRPAVG